MANELEKLSQEQLAFIQKIGRLDPVTRGCFLALTSRGQHVDNGALWSTVSTQDIKGDADITEAIKSKTAVQYWGIPTGMIVSVNPSVFFQGFTKVDQDLAHHYNKLYNEARQKAVDLFKKRLNRFFKSEVKNGKGQLRVGIFSVNASPKATAQDGAKIDAYQLDFSGMSTILQSVAQSYGVRATVQVAPQVFFPAGQFLSPSTNIAKAQMCKDENALEVSILVG